ncbi:MAG: PAS domain S-box protein [Pseudomonadota bacterium]
MQLDEQNLGSNQLWSLLELATEGIWRWDVVNDDVLWSPKLRKTLGYDDSNLARADVIELTHPDDRERHVTAIEEHLAKNNDYVIEVRLQKADGRYAWYLARGLSERDAEGRVLVMLGYVVSIEAQKNSERRLADSEARFRAFMDNAPAGVFLKDADGAHLYANRVAAELAATTVETMMGNTSAAFFPESTAKELMDMDRRVLESNALERWNGYITRSDGSRRFVHNVKFPVQINGDTVALGGFGLDITELRESQEALESVKRLESVGRLAGGVAHDFNNMLGVIIGFAELAMAGIGTNHPASQSVEGVIDAAQRSAKITKQLLGYARRQTIRPKRLDLAYEVERLLGILDRMIGEQISLSLNVSDDLWRVKLDPAQLDQVLTNLCINAKDAIGGKPGSVRIQLSNFDVEDDDRFSARDLLPGQYVRLSVIDSGKGISQDDIPQLFEPFFTTKEQDGTGLGLATVYGIVMQNGGLISVDSTPGNGASFHILVPRAIDSDEESTWKHESEITEGGGRSILLVEDEPRLLEVVRQMLESMDYRVTATTKSDDALKAAAEETFDLLLSDLVLTEGSGVDLAERLLMVTPSTRVLFMSGHAETALQKRLLDNEDVHFIQKPFTRDEISAAIDAALSNGD